MMTGTIGQPFRTCYKLVAIDFQELKEDDMFVLVDPDSLVKDNDGNVVFQADSDALPSNGVYGVKVRPLKF